MSGPVLSGGEDLNVDRAIALQQEPKDLTCELWREYDFGGRVYRIDKPLQLYIGKTTHRVVDASGIVHCVPAPGQAGCVLRWQSRDATKPVEF